MRVASWIFVAWIALAGAMPAVAADPAERTHEFRVTGMTCALCPIQIEKGLEAVEGVRSVEVDQKAERVRVVALAAVAPSALESAIEEAGHFEAEVLGDR